MSSAAPTHGERAILHRMSTLIDDAVLVLRQLPEDLQEAAARAILAFDGDDDGSLQQADRSLREHCEPLRASIPRNRSSHVGVSC